MRKRQVRLKRIFLINHYFSQKGQALVELATFGTVLLFCLGMLINFGLQANYQQEIEMKAFRQAMQQAYANDNRGPNALGETNLIEDKPGITVQDPYGVSERYPFGAGAKVTWNNNLMDEYVDEKDKLQDGSPGQKDYRPKVSYTVNAGVYGPYTTANFEKYECKGTITVRIPLLNHQDTDGDLIEDKVWKDVTIDCATQTKVFIDELSKDEPKPLVGYIRNNAEFPEKEQISSILIKDKYGTSRLKTVVKVEGKIFKKDGKKIGGPIQWFTLLDTEKGQIDTAVEIPLNPDGSKNLEEYTKRRQGLLPGYDKTINKSGDFKKRETKTDITTTTSATSTENITRQIRLNNGGPPVDVKTKDPLYTGKDITWTTPK